MGDKTTKWYRDIPFFFILIFSLLYCLQTFLPGTLLNFKINLSNKVLHSIIFKSLFIIPLFGFLYYFNYVLIQKHTLIKPITQRLYYFKDH